MLQTALGGRQNIGGYACFLDLARIRASSMQDSEPFCQFCLLSRYYIVFQVTHSPCPSALFRLHSSFVLEAIKCTVLFSICFHRLLRCRVRDKPYGYSLPKERNVRLSPHSAHVSITHNIPFARLDWNS